MMKLLRALVRSATVHGVIDRAALSAYYLLFAALPLLVAMLDGLMLLGLDGVVRSLLLVIGEAMPRELGQVLEQELLRLAGAGSSQRALIGVVASLLAGHRAVEILVHGIAVAWGAHERRSLRTKATALGLTIALLLATLGALVLIAVGAWALTMARAGGWLTTTAVVGLATLRWVVVILLVHSGINLLYRSTERPLPARKLVTPGTALATLSWLAINKGFQVYLERITDLGATYGSLGTAIGLLSYGYLLALCVLMGAELDATRFRLRLTDVGPTTPTPTR